MVRSSLALLCLAGGISSALSCACPGECCREKFAKFEKEFGRNYVSEEVRALRYHIFSDNYQLIESENAKNLSYTLGITNFADYAHAEWKEFMFGFKVEHPFKGLPKLGTHGVGDAPDSVDWATKGGVSKVKNQGQCGSCWTFSATGAMEGAAVVAGRALVDLSPQNILDCDEATQSNKCGGGSMDQAFDWAKQSGIAGFSDYPYVCAEGVEGDCKKSKCDSSKKKVLEAGAITGYTDVEHTEGALESAVAQQPVSVAIEADQSVFQHYKGGVLTNKACGSQLDHGVLAVGYGTHETQGKYWKVKNSWGEQWGADGYILIERGPSAPEGGECGIRKMASYPTVKAASILVV